MTYSDTYMVSIKEKCMMSSETSLNMLLMNNNMQVRVAVVTVCRKTPSSRTLV